MKDCIVITKTEYQVKMLMDQLGKEYNNIGFWGRKQQNYDTTWIWTIKNNSYSGSSGYGCLENHVKNDINLPVILMENLEFFLS